jgi:hypothetical protein
VAFRARELVGRYRLVVSAELLRFVEQAFVEPAPPAERARVRAEALAEARQAELEITPQGTVISRAGAEEFYRVELALPDTLVDEVAFEKAPGLGVRLRKLSADTLVAVQVGKPDAVFERVPDA